MNLKGIDAFCQDFVSIKKEGGRKEGQEFRSLEVRRKLIALKNVNKPNSTTFIPDPCNPGPCGPGTICYTNHGAIAVCDCQPGLIPNPDTITGCILPDPCDPSPCGPGTICSTNNDATAICDCEPGLIPNPDTITGCVYHPCIPTPCGPGTNCYVDDEGSPVCKCIPGAVYILHSKFSASP